MKKPNPVPINLGPVIDITPETAAYYQEACDAWETHTEEEMAENYSGLSRGDACEWSIRGFTIQDWLNLEVLLLQLGQRMETLSTQIDFYINQLKDRYQAIQQKTE